MVHGTWTLFKPGALKNIADEVNKDNLSVVALQEVRWGPGVVVSDLGIQHYFTVNQNLSDLSFLKSEKNVTKH